MRIIFLFLFFCSSYWAETIDLGRHGQTEQVNVTAIRQANEDYLQKQFSQVNLSDYFKQLQAPQISFHTKIPIAETYRTYSQKLNTKSQYPDTTIFFFGINDASKRFLLRNKNVKFNYGYCVDFDSLQSLHDFKKEMQMQYPVAIINDDRVLKELNIIRYPAIVQVKNNIMTIQEGL